MNTYIIDGCPITATSFEEAMDIYRNLLVRCVHFTKF